MFFMFLNKNSIESDRSRIGPMKPLEFKISLLVKSYDKKNRNCYDAEKPIVSKLSKISIENCDSTN